MRRVYQATAVVLIGLGLYMALEARRLTLYTDLGPGPGFFPFWVGVLFVGIAAVWLGQVSLRTQPPMEADFVPSRTGVGRILAIMGSLLCYAFLLDIAGFRLAMLAFLFFLLRVLGRQKLIVSVIVSIVVSFGIYYSFTKWLDVPLPRASLEFLKGLGL